MIGWIARKLGIGHVEDVGAAMTANRKAAIHAEMARLSRQRAEAVRKKSRRSHIDAEMRSLRTALLKLEQGK